ncbi:PREDICTED: NDR1/HIN1-like protein 12 [Camelina sativa]|uniref:NDR1/HIN1-like protein 12 n=1 Tax=Camelina sativa TaxID=90675 RepID=A0ABM0TAL4_CAMSA|nr:PREDICTED: NDR1/HIN1-like protein 12 [Camelina sativa]
MAIKECGSHHSHSSGCRKFFPVIILFVILFVIILAVFLVWVVLQPSKPRFSLEEAIVSNFNISGNPLNILNSNFQVSISSENPNDKIGIYYDRLNLYASYHNQQITWQTAISPTYQGHKEVKMWSPIIGGNSVPVSSVIGLPIVPDQPGTIELTLYLFGQIRWKVGSFITGEYHLHVNCPASINVGNSAAGVMVGKNAMKYRIAKPCRVDV